MIICGIKLTHDASVAVIEDGKLLFSVELEKINNNKRYSELNDISKIDAILSSQGLAPKNVDRFVLDGWHGTGSNWNGPPILDQHIDGRDIKIEVAGYNESGLKSNILQRHVFENGLSISGHSYAYSSYMHVAGHVLGTYCASPFAQSNESAYVLVWDGGQYPRLYYVDPIKGLIENKGQLFFFLGTIYAIMGHYFGPYSRTDKQLANERAEFDMEGYFGGYSIAGKLMSYIALGKVQLDLLSELPKIHSREFEISNTFEHRYARAVKEHVTHRGYTDADILFTQHVYLENLLIQGLVAKVRRDGLAQQNFCFTGGSALNIKWNSAIRKSDIFRSTWIPPFPNDSGSGIGAACCEMFTEGTTALQWNVYSGPKISQGAMQKGWHRRFCTLKDLAHLLVLTEQPIVFLNGAAELGPRALGNRSILAAATRPEMKALLNRIKRREDFRPIAPICLEEYAREIFDPGIPDPYMLFDHRVNSEWKKRVPAICHLDGTARLQTVNAAENKDIYDLLTEYYRITGIPLLCNTSANLNGSGFFPDVESAMSWGGVNYIYSEGILYEMEISENEVRVNS